MTLRGSLAIVNTNKPNGGPKAIKVHPKNSINVMAVFLGLYSLLLSLIQTPSYQALSVLINLFWDPLLLLMCILPFGFRNKWFDFFRVRSQIPSLLVFFQGFFTVAKSSYDHFNCCLVFFGVHYNNITDHIDLVVRGFFSYKKSFGFQNNP